MSESTTATAEAVPADGIDLATLSPREALRHMHAAGIALVEGPEFARFLEAVQSESDAARSEEISAGDRAAEADYDTAILVSLRSVNVTDAVLASEFGWVHPSVQSMTKDKTGALVGSRIYGLKVRRSSALVVENGRPGLRIAEAWRTVSDQVKNGTDASKAAKAEATELGAKAKVTESTVRAISSMATNDGALARLIDENPAILAGLGVERLAKAHAAAKPNGNKPTPRGPVAPADALEEAAKAYATAATRLAAAASKYPQGPVTRATVTALNDGTVQMRKALPFLKGRSLAENAGQAAKVTTGETSKASQSGATSKTRKPRPTRPARRQQGTPRPKVTA